MSIDSKVEESHGHGSHGGNADYIAPIAAGIGAAAGVVLTGGIGGAALGAIGGYIVGKAVYSNKGH